MSGTFHPNNQANEGEAFLFVEEIHYDAYPPLALYGVPQGKISLCVVSPFDLRLIPIFPI